MTSSPPTHAVLTGCSAGGMGVIFNCDWFASNFYGETDVACRPEASWFGLPRRTLFLTLTLTHNPNPNHNP